MWTLILTLTFGTPAVTSVPGFASEHACQIAGQQWRTDYLAAPPGTLRGFLCVNLRP